MPSEGQGYFDRLTAAKTELRIAKMQLAEARNKRDELRRQVDNEEPTLGTTLLTVAQTIPHPLDEAILKLKGNLNELLLRYTLKHPDVMAVRETLGELEQQRKEDLEALVKRDSPGASVADANPVFQQLKINLGEVEAEVVSLSTRTNEYQKRVIELEQRVETVPQIEADLVRLTRDYQIYKEQYEQLLKRRESAKLSQRVEAQADNVKFKIIDPPFVPSDPVGPNRPLFMSIVFLGGIAAGIGMAFFVSQIRPVFHSSKSLQEFSQYVVLGSVGAVRNTQEILKKRLEMTFFSMFIVGLLVVYGVMVGKQILGVE